MATFADRLKELRTTNGITQKQMAEFLEIIERHYQKLEYGKIKPSQEKLIKLANYFGVPVDYLLGRSIKLTSSKEGAELKKATQPLVLELANKEKREYLKKEYTVSVPCTDKEYEFCVDEFNNAWDNGERTPVDDFDKLMEDMDKVSDE